MWTWAAPTLGTSGFGPMTLHLGRWLFTSYKMVPALVGGVGKRLGGSWRPSCFCWCLMFQTSKMIFWEGFHEHWYLFCIHRLIQNVQGPHILDDRQTKQMRESYQIFFLTQALNGAGVSTYLYHKHQPNVGKYIIHSDFLAYPNLATKNTLNVYRQKHHIYIYMCVYTYISPKASHFCR